MIVDWGMVEKLSSLYGESFYLLESQKIKDNYKEFLAAFSNIYSKTKIAYSYKTNYIPKLCKIIDDLGGYAEVVSDMEYNLAIKIGVMPERIVVNGPYKSKEFLELLLNNNSIVNIDSYQEMSLIEQIAKEKGKTIEIGLRCNFKLNDSQISRFGFDISSVEFIKLIERINNNKKINIIGLHCHYPNRDLNSFVKRTDIILNLVDELFLTPPKYIDIGGGFFGKMDEILKKQFTNIHSDYQEYAKVIATKFKNHFKNYNDVEKPILFLEPGTALVADTMKYVVKIVDIKRIHEKYIAITTGSKLNYGTISSIINLPISVFSNNKDILGEDDYFDSIDVSGYTCIEDDYLYKGYKGYLKLGDYLVLHNVGSYSFLFKPPFILPNVAIIDYDYKKNSYDLIKKKEHFNNIFETFVF